jgi:hypothetical protein
MRFNARTPVNLRFSVRIAVLMLINALVSSTSGHADEFSMPWRISVYGGTATRLTTSEIFLHGHFRPDGTQIGVSIDRDLADLGSGFTLVADAGGTQFVAKSKETSLDLGLGVRYSFKFFGDPVSISGFTGPSWANGEPTISTGTYHGTDINFKRVPWLNYVGTEIAVGLAPNWNGVLRYYHRSGAFGLFEPNADEGSMLGFGLQYRF